MISRRTGDLLREGRPGDFQAGGFPLFSGKIPIVLRTLSEMCSL